jgi:hypothetical protein
MFISRETRPSSDRGGRMGPHDHHHSWGGHGAGGPAAFWLLLLAFLTVVLLLWPLLRAANVAVVVESATSWLTAGARARWRAAMAGQARVAQSFAAYECDPGAVLRLPALADVRQPATADFVVAFATAEALRTDRYPGPAVAERFTMAAQHAAHAWTAAVEAAERWRQARFEPGEQALLAQAASLLALARSTPHAGERAVAYRRTAEHLAELDRRCGWSLPPRTADRLDEELRAAVTAAPSDVAAQ